MRFRYGASVTPSAPVVDAVISRHEGRSSSKVRALIDAGASVTVMPARLVEGLGLVQRGRELVMGAFGADAPYRYKVRVTVGGVEFGAIRAAAMEGDWTIIGRDIINLWKMTLDGDSETIDMRAWTKDAGAAFRHGRRAGS